MYKVNPDAFRGVFVLPSEVTDQYLLLASGDMLKVLLFAFRNADKALSPAEIAEGTGIKEENVSDALRFWEEKGLLSNCDPASSAAQAQETKNEPAKAEARPEKIAVIEKPTLPSYDMICKRAAESDDVRILFAEAQMKLGRTIGPADQSRLLMLLDYYGLPVEVILTICEYARRNKQTTAQIYEMGIGWSKREIITLEAADEELKRLESVYLLWQDFIRMSGVRLQKLSLPQRKLFETWKSDWHFSNEMIKLAFDEMSRHTESLSFSYVNRILAKWKDQGIDSPEKFADHEKKRAEALEEKAAGKKTAYAKRAQPEEPVKASYDIDAAAQKMKTTVPTLKKKEKRP